MRPRTVGILLVGAGTLLAFSIVKQMSFPGMTEFLLITLAHIVLAVAVVGLALCAVRPRALAWMLGLLWGLAWAGFHGNELLMLLFILPPPWLSPAAGAAIVLFGVLTGAAALIRPSGRAPAASVLVLAVLSSAFIWARWLLAPLPVALYPPVLIAADAVGIGVLLLISARARPASRRRLSRTAG